MVNFDRRITSDLTNFGTGPGRGGKTEGEALHHGKCLGMDQKGLQPDDLDLSVPLVPCL